MFTEGYFKTSKGYILKNFENTAFILLKNAKLNDYEKEFIKIDPCLNNIIDGENFEEVINFTTNLSNFRYAIESIGVEIDIKARSFEFLPSVYFIPDKEGCSISSKKYDNLTSCYPIKFIGKSEDAITKIYFSPRLLLNCLECLVDKEIEIFIKRCTKKCSAYIMKILLKDSEIYICSMSDEG